MGFVVLSIIMGRTTDLRRTLKATFVPYVTELGFEIDQRHAPGFLDFRRARNGRIQILEIQWEKYGRPRFKFIFCSISQRGSDCRGTHVPASDAGPGNAPCYVCLYPKGNGRSTRHWFRQDYSLINALLHMRRLRDANGVCSELIELFSEVEHYFSNGVIGPHSRLYKTGFTDAT